MWRASDTLLLKTRIFVLVFLVLCSFTTSPASSADSTVGTYTAKCANPSPSQSWFSVISGNGKVVVKTAKQDYVQVSADKQLTWTSAVIPSANNIIFTAINFDGSKIYVGDNDGGSKTNPNSGVAIWLSTDFGISWAKLSARPWNDFGNYGIVGLTTSRDGNTLYVAAAERIYKSIDSGMSWSLVPIDGLHQWTAISTSANGRYLLINSTGGAYLSRDYGVSVQKTLTFSGLAEVNQVSQDGKNLIVQEDFAGINHLSNDFGKTWISFPGIAGAIALSENGDTVVAKLYSPESNAWNWAYSDTKKIKWNRIQSLSGGESGIYFYLYVGIYISPNAKRIILGNCTNTRNGVE